MLDIKRIRKDPETVKDLLLKKGGGEELDNLLQLDSRRRKLVTEVDELKRIRNEVSRTIGELKKRGEDATDKIIEMRELGDEIKAIDENIRALEADMQELLGKIPNTPNPDVPVGKGEEDNVLVREWGKKAEFDFIPRDHLSIGKSLKLLDFESSAKVSGSGFPLYRGQGAKLERALINFMLDYHVEHHNYLEVFPPFLTTRKSAFGTGQLPKLEEDMYVTTEDDLFLIPTAEVPITNIHREEILSEDALPIKYVGYSACFRREAGSHGKETRGLLRVHQFNKVEMVKFTLPEKSYEEHETLLKDAEDVLQALGLHYRVLELCTADLSFAAAKCYDIEVWAPGEGKYLEVSSVSNFEDFQARRAGIRFRRQKNKKVEYVHTLNGSGVATARLMVALLETYQTEEGTVMIPEALQPYFGNNVVRRGN